MDSSEQLRYLCVLRAALQNYLHTHSRTHTNTHIHTLPTCLDKVQLQQLSSKQQQETKKNVSTSYLFCFTAGESKESSEGDGGEG